MRRLISPFNRSIGLVEQIFAQCSLGKSMNTSASISALSSKVANSADCRAAGQRHGPLLSGGCQGVLGKNHCDKGRDDTAPVLAGMSQGVAHEVNAASLPADTEHRAGGGTEDETSSIEMPARFW